MIFPTNNQSSRFITPKLILLQTSLRKSVGIRNFSSQNINSFTNLFCEFDWNSLTHADANAAYNGFVRKYTEFYNQSCPLKFYRGKSLKALCVIRGWQLDFWNLLKPNPDKILKKYLLKSVNPTTRNLKIN